MEEYRTERIDKYYVPSTDNNKIYLKWMSYNNKQNIIEVDISNISEFSKGMLIKNIAMYKRFNKKLDVLIIRDYSSVPQNLRKYYRYTLLVPEEMDLTRDDDIRIYSLYFSKVKATILQALPHDTILSTSEYVPNVNLIVYKVNDKSVLETAAKVIATPFTLVADIIAIPVGIMYFGLTWKGP